MISSIRGSSFSLMPYILSPKQSRLPSLLSLAVASLFASSVHSGESETLEGKVRVITDVQDQGLLGEIKKVVQRRVGAMEKDDSPGPKLLFPSIRDHFYFSETHELMNNSILFYQGITDKKVFAFYKTSLERVAKELKLQGLHEIELQLLALDRTSPSIFQKWHYNPKSSYTMSAVLYNGPMGEKESLEIACNETYGPFPYSEEPLTDDSFLAPDKASKVSISYPENSAILVSSERGHLLHRMSPVNTSRSSSSLIYFQITLTDRTWGPMIPRSKTD